MANLSPGRRLRTKTSDLTDFFRGTGHSSSQARQQDASTMNLEVPSGDESGLTTKKKITRIPLFGRSRKKSNQSAASSPFSSIVMRDSSDLGEHSNRGQSTDRRPSEPAVVPPLPTPTLGSKIVAHFAHPRPSKVSATQAESTPPQPVARFSGLVPPMPRSASFESGCSSGTKTRSTTPRPARPTIMVSLTDNNEEFMDLFARPTDFPIHSPKTRSRPSVIEDQTKTSSSTPPSSPVTRSPAPSSYKRGHTPASAIAAAVRHQHGSTTERPPSTSSKNSSTRQNSDSDKSHDGTSTPQLSGPRESPRPVPLEKEKVIPPSLQRKTSVATGAAQSSETPPSSIRSRMRLPSTNSRSGPPSMALPHPPHSPSTRPPSSPPPSGPLPSAPPQGASNVLPESETAAKIPTRSRAHTLSSSTGGSISLPSPLSLPQRPRTSTSTNEPQSIVRELSVPDIDSASADDLRKVLKQRNQQCDELSRVIFKMNEAHTAEISVLEKKVALLEREARRRETQIKGFTWILNDGEAPQQQPKALPPGIPAMVRRLAYQSDSGAESHATSGAESLRASGASGTESMTSISRNKKLVNHSVAENRQNISHTGSMRRTSKTPPAVNSDKALPDTPYSFGAKRSSITSVSTSPSSSTSSLLTPSPSITMSSLSAIPEGSGPTSILRLPRLENADPEDRRATRASHRTSTSSMTSSNTASSTYSTTIKRSRPPSIAQVLESPNLEDVLDKLRPFS